MVLCDRWFYSGGFVLQDRLDLRARAVRTASPAWQDLAALTASLVSPDPAVPPAAQALTDRTDSQVGTSRHVYEVQNIPL